MNIAYMDHLVTLLSFQKELGLILAHPKAFLPFGAIVSYSFIIMYYNELNKYILNN
jgi:hypothetical protein